MLDKFGNLLAGLKSGLFKIEFTSTNTKLNFTRIDSINKDFANIRFNDGACDKHGCIWAGTMDIEGKAPIG